MNRAIFLVGGPGSGKDIVLKEALSNFNIREFNTEQVKNVVKKFFKEILVITGNAYNYDKIKESKEILESKNYLTSMIYVDVSDDVSRQRLINRGLSEEIRLDRLIDSKINLEKFQELFSEFYYIDNNYDSHSEETQLQLESLVEDLRPGSTLTDKRKIGIRARMDSLRRTDAKQHKNVAAEIQAKHLGSHLAKNAFKFHNKKAKMIKANVIEFKDRLKHQAEEYSAPIEEAKKDKKKINVDSHIGNPVRGTGIGPVFDLRSSGDYRLGGISNIVASESVDSPSATEPGFPGVEGSAYNKDTVDIPVSHEYAIKKKRTNFQKDKEVTKNEAVLSRARKIILKPIPKK